MTYFNTTSATGDTLKIYQRAADSQEQLILDYFKSHKRGITTEYSPSFIQRAVLPDAPITSVRRALTNLTDELELVKTENQVMGLFGRHEHTWKLYERIIDLRQGDLF